MSLEQLDAFLAKAHQQPELDRLLHDRQNPLDLEAFLALGRAAGFSINENDVIAAQQRELETLSHQEIQHQAGAEARRLRHFIPG